MLVNSCSSSLNNSLFMVTRIQSHWGTQKRFSIRLVQPLSIISQSLKFMVDTRDLTKTRFSLCLCLLSLRCKPHPWRNTYDKT